eukprot:6456558-Amphidinium_carterae.1
MRSRPLPLPRLDILAKTLALAAVHLSFQPLHTATPTCLLITHMCGAIRAVQTVLQLCYAWRIPHQLTAMLACHPTLASILVGGPQFPP